MQNEPPNRSKKVHAFILQFAKFGIVGMLNTFISLSVYYLFLYINADWYIIGNVSGFIASVLNSFYWNSKYVFHATGEGSSIPKLVKTFIVYGSTFLLSTILLYFEVQYLGIAKWLAPLINLIVTMPLNFVLNKFWAFKK